MTMYQSSFTAFDRMLQQAPVVGDVHPLLPICLDPETYIFDDPNAFLDMVDDQEQFINQPVLLLKGNAAIYERFNRLISLDHPPVETINRNMQFHLSYIRNKLLTTHKVAAHIEKDVAHHQYELVVFLLVDGLSYGDTLNWGYEIVPCFVDGPSVTFQTDAEDKLIPSIGFASIINNPSVGQKLYRLGYQNAFGYTYWQARNNLLAGYMFRDVPDNEVVNFESILNIIDDEQFPQRTYVQIVREGLDGLAHSKRELRTKEVTAAAQSLHDDIERLIKIIRKKSSNAVIYATADHGVLWKNDHDWKVVHESGSKARYSVTKPEDDLLAYTVRFECNHIPYYLYTYPYLGKSIRKNDSGVHGGLSYQESFVPFIKIEV